MQKPKRGHTSVQEATGLALLANEMPTTVIQRGVLRPLPPACFRPGKGDVIEISSDDDEEESNVPSNVRGDIRQCSGCESICVSSMQT